MKKILLILLSLSLLFAFFGCEKVPEPIGKVPEAIGFRGDITEVRNGNSDQLTILVEGIKEDDVAYDKAYVTITKETKIIQGTSTKTLSIDQLKKGLKVEGVFEGAVAESYPVQGTAKSIRILE